MLILFTQSCNMGKQVDEKIILSIDFQDFFDKDKVGCSINGCSIFKDVELTSDQIDGLTDVNINVSKKGHELIIHYDNKIINCSEEKILELVIDVNGQESKYELILDKGKYIGFDKLEGNKLKLHQSELPFEYD